MAVTQETLFDAAEYLVLVPNEDDADAPTSRLRRMRRRQLGLLVTGWHPVGWRPLHPRAGSALDRNGPGLRCGDCALRVLTGGHARPYPKCDAPAARRSRGPATDVAAWWPACSSFRRRRATPAAV